MPGITDYRTWLIGLAVVAAFIVAAWLLIEADASACRVECPPPPYPSPRPPATLTVNLPTSWTLAHAGLVGPAAWLTAPRETDEFAATRAAIAAQYARAERRTTTAARRAGMTKKAGWKCA